MNKINYITLTTKEEQQKHSPGTSCLSQKEKEARLYALADELHVKIGGKHDRP